MGDAESGDKPGAEACQAEEEEEDDDGIFSPVRIPGEEDQAQTVDYSVSYLRNSVQIIQIFCAVS